jgi:hypothetical protein
MMTSRVKNGPGTFADDDLKLRYRCLVDMIVRHEAGARAAEQEFTATTAAARKNGQAAIVDAAIRDLAERRAR